MNLYIRKENRDDFVVRSIIKEGNYIWNVACNIIIELIILMNRIYNELNKISGIKSSSNQPNPQIWFPQHDKWYYPYQCDTIIHIIGIYINKILDITSQWKLWKF